MSARGFEHPWAFVLLAFVPLLAIFYAAALRSRRAALARLMGDPPAAFLSRGAGRDRRALEAALATTTFCLVVLAIAGPRWGRDKQKAARRGADVVVVLDVSRSMLAEDVAPSRLGRARREIRGLLDAATGDRIALVTFAGDALVACPLTLDHDTLGMFVDEADPSIDHRGGSDLAAALAAAGTALDAASGAGKAVIVLSDGEDFQGGASSGAVAAASELAARGVHVHAIGLGTADGAKIPVTDDRGKTSFFKDARGNEVITKLEPVTLRAIAAAGSGEFLEADQTAFPMDELWTKRVSRLAKGDTGTGDVQSLVARFQWFLALAILAASFWWIVPLGIGAPARTASVGGRRRVARPGGSRGPSSRAAAVLAAGVLAGAGVSLSSRVARAGAVEEGANGDALYRNGDFDGAAAAYSFASEGAAAENGPFNLGNAKFRSKKYREAGRAWGEAEKRASDPAVRRDASFNRGNALLAAADPSDPDRVADLKQAVDAFDAALRLDPTDADVRHNRAIAIARWVDAQKNPPPQKSGGGSKNGSPSGESKDDKSKSTKDGQSGDPKDGSKKDGKQGKESTPGKDGEQAKNGNGGKDGEKKDPQGGGSPAPGVTPSDSQDAQDGTASPDGAAPPDAAALGRLDRLLDAKEREQRRLEMKKARMHRQQGENQW